MKNNWLNPKESRKRRIKEQRLCVRNRKQIVKDKIKLKYISNCIKCNWTKDYI